jgi:hypothetical protein
MNPNLHSSPEHEFEAQLGLPEKLPQGESILWQGAPDFKAVALRVFHMRALFIYFGILLAYRLISGIYDGDAIASLGMSMLWMTLLSATCLGLVAYFAHLICSTTLYTLTDRRIVMRIGIVLNMTFNLPLKKIQSAGLNVGQHGVGDIPLKLDEHNKIAVFHLWPHAKPGAWANPEPMLRCIPDSQKVASLLSDAWAKANQVDLAEQTVRAAKTDAPVYADVQSGHSGLNGEIKAA